MTAEATLPIRSAIPEQYRWNAEAVFPTRDAWRAEYAAIEAALPGLPPYAGTLNQGSARLAEWLDLQEGLERRIDKLSFYARMAAACDSSDTEAIGMAGQVGGLFGRFSAACAFSQPELLAIGQETLMRWAAEEARLAIYAHAFHDLFRQQAHVRSAEVEEILALAGDIQGQIGATYDLLESADMQFRPVAGLPLAQSTIGQFLHGADREARRQAWEQYADVYLAHKQTLTSNYLASVKADVFQAISRRYETVLDASLFGNAIPREVFTNLINTYRKHIPTWHKYWAVRRKALGVETLHPYDIWAPISSASPAVAYEQAVDWIATALRPLGADYSHTLRQGCLEERWVDVYPSQGKGAGAFSYGTYDTAPYIMMSYTDDLASMSTLAHELGHSMHSQLSRTHQPYVYGDYSLFVAEVASNFNQAMTRAHLFQQGGDAAFQIALIEEAMQNIHRYFFIMPILASFELEVHTRIEQGKAVTAEDLIALCTELFSEGYGGEMHLDHDRVGITWAQFGHLYNAYYVYQYATGISAAHALAGRILAGEPGAAEAYVRFLSTGSAQYPVDALMTAGVDMRGPEAVERTFAVLADYVDRLAALTA